MFVWSMMITSAMVLFATPSLTVAISLLLADRAQRRQRERTALEERVLHHDEREPPGQGDGEDGDLGPGELPHAEAP